MTVLFPKLLQLGGSHHKTNLSILRSKLTSSIYQDKTKTKVQQGKSVAAINDGKLNQDHSLQKCRKLHYAAKNNSTRFYKKMKKHPLPVRHVDVECLKGYSQQEKNILLKCRTELGKVHMVKSVLPIPNPCNQKDIQETRETFYWSPLLDFMEGVTPHNLKHNPTGIIIICFSFIQKVFVGFGDMNCSFLIGLLCCVGRLFVKVITSDQ